MKRDLAYHKGKYVFFRQILPHAKTMAHFNEVKQSLRLTARKIEQIERKVFN